VSQADWLHVNQALLAKAIGELAYEQVLSPVVEESAGLGRWRAYSLRLQNGARYEFLGWRTVWDYLRVRPGSVKRNGQAAESAALFFADSLPETNMGELTLGVFLEELHNTLYSDLALLERNRGLSSRALSLQSGDEMQGALNGHPKLLNNKGRMGFGAHDLQRFSPECGASFRLFWIAVRGPQVETDPGYSADALLPESLDEAELARFRAAAGLLPAGDFRWLPLHPWQWDRVVKVQYASEIALGRIFPLGEFGDLYRPQISLRTLSNLSRPARADLKLPLSVLNTSAVRGISPRYIPTAPALAAAVEGMCARDPWLASVQLLPEIAGISYRHPAFHAVAGMPYRYGETLGALWRQSAGAYLREGEQAVLTGALFHQDFESSSLIGAFIERSGLGAEEWLRLYFRAVVIPLYHLQRRYGLGLVAHGQNVVVRLRHGRPVGVFLKDFQGDLRAAEGANSERDQALGDLLAGLERLPPHYLIHDLVTGHFVTVLRFVSAVLEESDGFPESRFYALLAQEVRSYLEASGGESAGAVDLLGERTARVLVNKVRFQIGYGDSASRPRPLLGGELRNPLARAAAEARP
jgi:aerobactin synthase